MTTSEILRTYIYPSLDIECIVGELFVKERANSYTLECPQCGKKEAYILKKNESIIPYIYCNRLNKCGYKSSLWDFVQKRGNLSNKETLYLLSECANVDISQFSYTKSGYTKQKKENIIEIKIVQKPLKLLDIQRFYNIDFLIDDFLELDEKLQFCTIVSFIYNFSLKTNQDKKEKYYHDRGIKKCDDIGCLTKDDAKELSKLLLTYFPLDILNKFSIFKGNNFKYSFSDFSVIPSFDLYSNLQTAIRLRNLDKNATIKEIEVSHSRIANPLPYGLTKEKLQKYNTFLFTEGHIDALSLNLENFVAVSGVNGFDKKFFGLFKDKKIYILFDQDEAGQDGALRLQKTAKSFGIKAKIISWDKNIAKDVNELLTNNALYVLSEAFLD